VLTNASNDFSGAVALNSSSNAAITAGDGLNLGIAVINGDLNAVAIAGDIINSGALSVGGDTF